MMDRKKKDFIREWTYEANNDLGLANFVIDNGGQYYDLVCFHCQQAAEKFLKAYIIYLNLYYKKSHDLTYLLNVVKSKREVSKTLYNKAELLNSFSVDSRYPDHWHDPDLLKTKECLKAARDFKSFVYKDIEELL